MSNLIDDRSNPWEDETSAPAATLRDTSAAVKKSSPVSTQAVVGQNTEEMSVQVEAASTKDQKSKKEKLKDNNKATGAGVEKDADLGEAEPSSQHGDRTKNKQAITDKSKQKSQENKKENKKSEATAPRSVSAKAAATAMHHAAQPSPVDPAILMPVTTQPPRRALVFERPHYPSQKQFDMNRRVVLPPLYTILPCFSKQGRPQPMAMPPSYMQAAHPLQLAMAQPPIPNQNVEPAEKPESAANPETAEKPEKAEKAKKPKRDKKADPPASSIASSISSTASAPAPAERQSPVIVNIYTAAGGRPEVKTQQEEVEVVANEPQNDARKGTQGRKKDGAPAEPTNVKIVKKKTVIAVESSDEEAEAYAAPNKRVTKTTRVKELQVEDTIDSDVDEEAVPAAKSKKSNPSNAGGAAQSLNTKKIKQLKKVLFEEKTSDDEVVAENVPFKKSKKKNRAKEAASDSSKPAEKAGSTSSTASATSGRAKKSLSSSATSAEPTDPPNYRMMGSGRYDGGKATVKHNKLASHKENEKADGGAKDDDNSSINSSQRGAKPTAAQCNPRQSAWQAPPPWYPGPSYGGGYVPQAWPAMFPPPGAPMPAPADEKKPASKTSSKTTSKGSASKIVDEKPPTLVPAADAWGKTVPTVSPKTSSVRKTLVTKQQVSLPPSVIGSVKQQSDISFHAPANWRGTIVVKDTIRPERSDIGRHHRSRAPSAASRRLSPARTEELNDAYALPPEDVDVRIRHRSVSRLRESPQIPMTPRRASQPSNPSPRSQQRPASSYRPASAAPTSSVFTFSPSHEREAHTTARTSPRHNQRVWQHPDHLDIWKLVSTSDEFDRGREIHPNDSASQVNVRDDFGAPIRSARDGRDVGDERDWDVSFKMTRRRSVERPVGRAETVLTSAEGGSHGPRRAGAQILESRERSLSRQDSGGNLGHGRQLSRAVSKSRASRVSSVASKSRATDISKASHVSSHRSRRHAESDDEGDEAPPQLVRYERRRYTEHQSELSRGSESRRTSYRRPDYLEVQEEEDVVDEWHAARGGGGGAASAAVQW